MNDKTRSYRLQGTPFFMVFEVMTERRLQYCGFKQPRDMVVIPNFCHDVESFWWILLWTISARARNSAADLVNLVFSREREITVERARVFQFASAFSYFFEVDILDKFHDLQEQYEAIESSEKA